MKNFIQLYGKIKVFIITRLIVPNKSILKPIYNTLYVPIHRFYRRRKQILLGTGNSLIYIIIGFLRKKTTSIFVNKTISQNDPRIDTLTKEGFVRLQDFYDPKIIQKIDARWDELSKNDELINVAGNYKFLEAEQVLDYFPEIIDLVKKPELHELMHNYYNCPFLFCGITIGSTFHISDEEIKRKGAYSMVWHFDVHPSDFIHLVIPLKDVTEKDGPTFWSPKDRTRELLKKGYYRRQNYSLSIEELEHPQHMKKLTASAGDAIIFSPCSCLHRASVPSENHGRDMIFISLRAGLEPHYVQSLSPFQKLGYKIAWYLTEDWENPSQFANKNITTT